MRIGGRFHGEEILLFLLEERDAGMSLWRIPMMDSCGHLGVSLTISAQEIPVMVIEDVLCHFERAKFRQILD
jgi:hypothetical protein